MSERSKVIIKLPLNRQVLNSNHRDIQWSQENDKALIKIIESSSIQDFKISNMNIDSLSTQFQVPIDFLLKKIIQLYNELQLAKTGSEILMADPVRYNVAKNHEVDEEEVERHDMENGKTEVINGDYSYYIDKNGYSNTSEEQEESEEENLIKSSEFLLHRSKILPIPKFNTSSMKDFFSDHEEQNSDEEEEYGSEEDQHQQRQPEQQLGYRYSASVRNGETNNNTVTINNEGVNGIISNKKLDRKNSGASDLSNRSELEKLLLDRIDRL